MKQIVKKRKDIAFYIKMYPLPMHPEAPEKSRAILCGKNPLELLGKAFEGKPLPKADCPAPQIEQNVQLARSLGITGTPTMILPNGRIFVGFRPADELIQVIEEAGKEAQTSKAAPRKTAPKKG